MLPMMTKQKSGRHESCLPPLILGLRLHEWVFVGLSSRGFPGRRECNLLAGIHGLVGFSKLVPLDLKLQDISHSF